MHTTYLQRTLVGLSMAVASVAQAAPFDHVYTGSTVGQPTFNRPLASVPWTPGVPMILSNQGSAVPYTAFSFSVGAGGAFDFVMTSTTMNFDPFLALYAGSFDPASPLAGVVVVNDDDGQGNSQRAAFRGIALTAGTPYTVVHTGYANWDAGSFSMSIAGPGEVLSPVPEPGTWALMLAGLGTVTWVARRRRAGETSPAA